MYPQEQHIAEEMQPAAMHEHGSENGDDVGRGVGREVGGDEGPTLDEVVACGELEQEYQAVQANEGVGNDGKSTAL